MPRDDLVPPENEIFGWIEQVFSQGIRRPGYPADRWAEQFCLDRFQAFGLENVRLEPVDLPYWEPKHASLSVRGAGDGQTLEIACFPLPHWAPTAGVEAQLVPLDLQSPENVRGSIAMYELPLTHVPHTAFADLATWHYDPDATFADSVQIVPFAMERQQIWQSSIDGGAAAFVGVLTGYPSDSHDYYVPYDAVPQPIPGVWISGSDGARLRELLAAGTVRARIEVDTVRETTTTYNIV
ncbi:MAG: hypothetical protein ACC682_17650, partial [Gemmatimonadota bacterium]